MILSGTLLTPTGELYANAYVRLDARSTSQQVLKLASSGFKTDEAGAYSIDCPFGSYSVVISSQGISQSIGVFSIDADTTETSINQLLILGQTVGSNPILQEIRQAVVEANTAVSDATTQATNAETAATAAAGSVVAADASATNASASEVSATSSAISAVAAVTSAQSAAESSATSATAAELAKTNAELAATAAQTTAAQINGYNLSTWALTQAFQVITATRDANGAITSADIKWPDGVLGVFTTDVASVAFPGAIDAWHATYLATVTKLITQPAVTRDSNGAVTAQPAITIV